MRRGKVVSGWREGLSLKARRRVGKILTRMKANDIKREKRWRGNSQRWRVEGERA